MPEYVVATPTSTTPTNTNPDDLTLDELHNAIDAKLPDTPVSAIDAMQAVVRADGDLLQASVALKTRKANVLSAIATDPSNHDTLSKYFRAHQTMKIFGLIQDLTESLRPEIDELKPNDKAKTLVALLDVFNKFTETTPTQTQGNPLEQVLRQFPPHVQSAIKQLALAEDNDPTVTMDAA